MAASDQVGGLFEGRCLPSPLTPTRFFPEGLVSRRPPHGRLRSFSLSLSTGDFANKRSYEALSLGGSRYD